MTSPNQSFLVAACALLAALALTGLVVPVATLSQLSERDWNEAWNAYWATAALAGSTLYPPPDAFISNNYPPLYFYVIGAAGLLTGDIILAGRTIALLSFLCVALNIFLLLRVSRASVATGLLGAVLFLCMGEVFDPYRRAMNDPQWLSHALITSGTVLLLRQPTQAAAIIGSALLMLIGGLVKHSTLALPVAATFWLLLQSRRSLPLWIGFSLTLATAVMSVCWLLYGQHFFSGIFQSPRQYARYWARMHLVWLLPFAPLLGAALLAKPGAVTEPRLRLPLIYLLLALAIGMGFSGGAGVDRNTYLDTLIASCWVVALAFDSAFGAGAPSARWNAYAALVLLTVPSAWQVLGIVRQDLVSATTLEDRERDMRMDIMRVRGLDSVAACDDLTVCYRAGVPFALDTFNFGQKVLTGALPETACTDAFASGRFPVLVLNEKSPPGSFRLPDACNASIRQHYRVAYESRERVIMLYQAGR